ncbi:MAG: ATP-dependent helicase [Acidobacteriota bacterium]
MSGKIFSDLNEEQAEAVRFIEKPLIILAGAGSGKTRVITNKIAYLIEEKGFSPLNILGVTFTNKAANEMKSRVTNITGVDPFLFNISTFHSLGLRILRESGEKSGFGRDWSVSDDKDQKKAVGNIVKEKFSYFTSDMIDDTVKKINRAKMNLLYPNNRDMLQRKGLTEDEIEVYSQYWDHQKKNKRWDFEDLISLPVLLISGDKKLREMYEARFSYVLVDEFQDTNPNQYELIRLIASRHGRITVVGDDDQAIYSWRGANVRYMSEFKEDFKGTKTMKMERNYRSTKEILGFANTLIRRNRFRQLKEMWTDRVSGNPVTLMLVSSKESEAEQVADLIEHYYDENPDMFPLAILYRINSQSFPFESVFRKRGIEYRIVKGLRFFDRKEIKDSVSLMRLAFNSDDDVSFLRVIDFLPLGIGPKSLEQIKIVSNEKGTSFLKTLKDHFSDKFDSKPIFKKIFEVENSAGRKSISQTLLSLLNDSGYMDYLKERREDDRLLNIDELLDFIRKWETETDETGNINELLDKLTLESGRETGENTEKVLLLTMHNSKGLEFPTVVMAGINETYMPFFMRKEKMEIEEERRLMYVASTRAIDRLIISTGGARESEFLMETGLSNVNVAYSYGELLGSISGVEPGLTGTGPEPDIVVEHPFFGEGVLLKQTDEKKYLVDFGEKGEKLIDTSIVELKFPSDS